MFGKRSLLLTLLAFMIVAASLALVHAPINPPPNISAPVIKPSSPGPYDTVTVSVNVTSPRSTIKNVTITYTTDNWKSVNTTVLATYDSTSGTATAQIPPLTQGGTVAYYITSYDSNGGKSVNNNNGRYFSYVVTAPSVVSTLTFVIVIGAIAAAISVVVYMIVKAPVGSSKQTTPSSYRE